MFRVGQQVVCVDDEDFEIPAYALEIGAVPNLPVRGRIYAIRRIDDDGSLFLCEIRNPEIFWPDGDIGEASFRPTRFRPIVDTDISIFTAMLTPSNTKVPA